jgi:hypothetical protein
MKLGAMKNNMHTTRGMLPQIFFEFLMLKSLKTPLESLGGDFNETCTKKKITMSR